MSIKKLKLKQGAYIGMAAIIDDPYIEEQFIIVARDTAALQRAASRLSAAFQLDTNLSKEVKVTSENE